MIIVIAQGLILVPLAPMLSGVAVLGIVALGAIAAL